MPHDDFTRQRSIFERAIALPPAERPLFVERECAGDVALRDEILDLIRLHESAGDIVESISEMPGMRVGPYKLLEQIGEGGFGVVFMAEQEQPVRRKVALKIIKLGMDTKQVVARFEQERQALAMMDHPNIAKVYDAGATPGGRPYFVMELVRGESVTQYCDREKLNTRDRVALFVDICKAVQHAHQKGIIHRDIKPTNVLVTIIDGKPVPKVIDFGVAKAAHSRLTNISFFTGMRQMIGTPLYMSPEQAEMSGVDIDTRTDIYSLGVLLYELLTGTTPLTQEQLLAAGIAEIHRMIRETDPPIPSTRVSTLGDAAVRVARQRKTEPGKLGVLLRGDLDWIVMKCLDKDRNRRYATPTNLAEDIERHLGGEPVQAAPPSVGYRAWKFIKKRKGVVGAVSAVVLALSIGFAATWYMKGEVEKREKDKDAALTRERNANTEKDAALKLAKEQKTEIERQKAVAEKERDAKEFEAYVANIRAAQTALKAGEYANCARHLKDCLERLRGSEWKYLNATSDTSLLLCNTVVQSFSCVSAPTERGS